MILTTLFLPMQKTPTCTILSKVGKEETSSMVVPTAPTLVARPDGKASDDNPYDDDPSLLNSDMAAF
jgi:hypothetical protein